MCVCVLGKEMKRREKHAKKRKENEREWAGKEEGTGCIARAKPSQTHKEQ